jgi:hypothetical protein
VRVSGTLCVYQMKMRSCGDRGGSSSRSRCILRHLHPSPSDLSLQHQPIGEREGEKLGRWKTDVICSWLYITYKLGKPKYL